MPASTPGASTPGAPALRWPARAALGFLAAAISVLTFHAAAWWGLYQLGRMPPPYPISPVPPLGIPLIASLALWGGLYGAMFGLALPRLKRPLIPWGIGLGILASLVGWLIVPLLKGGTPAAGSLEIPLIINGVWGIGVALIAPTLMHRPIVHYNIATK